ncbi:unnamed protein product [Soboliphyme baturini]|uniref:Bestrophin homolog n=1 Tax=Soboliphyme baturini TaxID=241478 RepID=A0A183J4C0_9BILA|nr:unnamed protein product [Soboliphyme baturini]
MTITYSQHVATGGTGHFLALLLWWKGSIYRLLYKEFIIYMVLYFAISLLYRFGLNEGGRDCHRKNDVKTQDWQTFFLPYFCSGADCQPLEPMPFER